MSNESDFVTVRPREVRLTHREQAKEGRSFTLPSVRTMAIGGAAVIIVAALFVFAPSWVPSPDVEPTSPSVPSPVLPGAIAPKTKAEPEQAPLERMIAERERARAQDTLSKYVELQIRLEEEMHVDQWAQAEYDAIGDRAAQADELFTQRKYDEAMAGYQEAADGLERLVALGEEKFEAALATAEAALREYQLDAAREAIGIATSIHPDDERLTPLNARADELPALIELTRGADELLRDGDEDGARAKLREAQKLDPDSGVLRQRLADLDGRFAERRFQELLTTGYAALEGGRFEDARGAFERALAQRPGDLGAQQGLEQVKQSGTLDRLQQLREGAERLEADERWAEALKSYNDVLRIDGTIKFAVDGKARSAERNDLDRDLEETIGHPEKLSSDEEFQAAVALQERANRVPEAGTRLTGQIAKLSQIVANASQPVPITLVSDNATHVTISQIGELGAFAEKRLSLRPGRYLVIGSRDGCRDVRKQIDVSRDMSPVDIRCEERL
jgi:tetratricopeptide (TPR) repeat protein